MAVNKVVANGKVLVDLTKDTVTADTLKMGYTAHDKSGALITGLLNQSGEIDDIDLVLVYGFSEGTRSFMDDGTITAKNSAGRTLTRTFSTDGKTCTSVLTDADGAELGRMAKTYGEDYNSPHSPHSRPCLGSAHSVVLFLVSRKKSKTKQKSVAHKWRICGGVPVPFFLRTQLDHPALVLTSYPEHCRRFPLCAGVH